MNIKYSPSVEEAPVLSFAGLSVSSKLLSMERNIGGSDLSYELYEFCKIPRGISCLVGTPNDMGRRFLLLGSGTECAGVNTWWHPRSTGGAGCQHKA